MPITQNLMPMGRVNERLSGGSILPPSPGAPARAAAPAPAGPMPSFPAPSAPIKPPWDVRMQPDGTSVYFENTPAGEIIRGVNPPPKIPKALQGAPQAQGTPPALQPPGA